MPHRIHIRGLADSALSACRPCSDPSPDLRSLLLTVYSVSILSCPPYDHIESVSQSYYFILPSISAHTISVLNSPSIEISQEWPSQVKAAVCPVQLDGGYISPIEEAHRSLHHS